MRDVPPPWLHAPKSTINKERFYISGMLAGLASVALALVGGFLGHLPLLLELVLELSAVDDILCAQFNGV